MEHKTLQFSDLIGQTITKVENSGDQLKFTLADGRVARLYHSRDCCESVSIEDICGNLNDLVGSPVVQAEENSSRDNPAGVTKEYQDSFTWTFYRIATAKGQCVIRWYGESNGYYSESVDFEFDPVPVVTSLPGLQPPFDLVGSIIAFESGELDAEATDIFFDYLVETGLWRSLQGFYGRALRAAGKI